MKDEIKEKMTIGKAKKILRGFLAKDCYYDTPLYYAIPYLLDYITNLQEENQRLKDIRKQAINYNKALCKIYDCGIELSNAETNLCILKDEETINTLQGKSDE